MAPEQKNKRHHLGAHGRYVFLTFSHLVLFLGLFMYLPWLLSHLHLVNFFTNNVSSTNKVAMYLDTYVEWDGSHNLIHPRSPINIT